MRSDGSFEEKPWLSPTSVLKHSHIDSYTTSPWIWVGYSWGYIASEAGARASKHTSLASRQENRAMGKSASPFVQFGDGL
ncbi:hypothetical protein FNF29_01841 [Cafeteria roenbergensis]|uniref:Uncharacterized protein n=1 Tax=Cafeteria roenbergensis TaxID=33653 RepID=A0A5A8CRX9_CAFRO|nr:hypothetical protein FNF29_01841 [Cafeteria roenbergensis]|eukprot:KAA0155468.1 hypothetical protein FNF29_01841 [Cafeteria roenbergensis]